MPPLPDRSRVLVVVLGRVSGIAVRLARINSLDGVNWVSCPWPRGDSVSRWFRLVRL